jgi:hypothetical protein
MLRHDAMGLLAELYQRCLGIRFSGKGLKGKLSLIFAIPTMREGAVAA